MIQDYGFGKIVGEQTADSPTLIAAIHDFKLPNTKLNVEYPKAFMVRPNGNVASRGVAPDYPVADEVSGSSDRTLAYTLKLIGERR